MTLYQYLIKKEYSEDEALETLIRYENNFEIPEKIKQDIKNYEKEKE